MRVLFTSVADSGHANPMVPLGKALVERGDELLWATTAGVADGLHAEGFRTAAAGLPVAAARASVASWFPAVLELPPAERRDAYFSKLFGAVIAPAMLAELLPAAREFAPELIVADVADLAAPVVSALLDVPLVAHGFGAPLPVGLLEKAAAECTGLWTSNTLSPRPLGGYGGEMYLDIYPPSLGAALSDMPIPVQPLQPARFAPSEGELPAALRGDGPPVVYATLGTVFNEEAGLLATMAAAIARAGARGLVTVGPNGDPAVVGDARAGVHVARYVPQDQVLPHCAAVMSHAGSGTFLASLGFGLPQVCIPLAADQFINAGFAAGAGVAMVVPPEDRSLELITAALTQVLSDDVLRKNAAAVRAEIEAMPTPAEVAGLLAQRFG